MYNTRVDARARSGCRDRVSALLEEMKKNRVEPDVVTYSTLVKGCCIGGDVDRVSRVMEDMNGEKKYGPDEILCNTLLDGCEKQGRVDDVLQLLDGMRADGVSPPRTTR